MMSSAVAPSCVAFKSSLNVSPRQTPAAVRLPARRISRSVVAAAQKPSKVQRCNSSPSQREPLARIIILLAEASPGNTQDKKLMVTLSQAQVASAATALTALTLAVAPAAQAAQEAFIVADVSYFTCSQLAAL